MCGLPTDGMSRGTNVPVLRLLRRIVDLLTRHAATSLALIGDSGNIASAATGRGNKSVGNGPENERATTTMSHRESESSFIPAPMGTSRGP